jgi:cyclopropane-fatty-acyl-phospholipid synthase
VDKRIKRSLGLIQMLFGENQSRNFAIKFWDGSIWEPSPGEPPAFTIVLCHPGALRKMLLPPNDLSMGEAYIYGDIDIEGDFEAVFSVGYGIIQRKWSLLAYARLVSHVLALPSSKSSSKLNGNHAANLGGVQHSKLRDQQAISHHYDVSNEFYALWLDQNMVYSCAYFAAPDEDIDTAQQRKLDYICRKLRLQKGERLLDIGCGWGGLILHAARNYGVEALGITLSKAQAEWANARIAASGLQSRCRVELHDYRDLEPTMQYEKLVSVGMFEHVGSKKLPAYFEQAWRLLRPGGIFLNHGISADINNSSGTTSPFINRYVFPDGEVVNLSETIQIAEETGFEVRDVESLREHYSLTLQRWVHQLQLNHEAAIQMVGPVAYRIWQLYMAGARYGFDTRLQNIYQVLLAKPRDYKAGLPLTRADWYVGNTSE